MNLKITFKQLIITNIFLCVCSFVFMEFSNYFRLNPETHWIYSLAHLWWIFFALPVCFIGSLMLTIFSYRKLTNKLFWILLSLAPIFICIILASILEILNLR